MLDNKNRVYPVQPFFILRASHYYEKRIYRSNIAQFYQFRMDKNTIIAVPDDCVDIIFSCDSNDPDACIFGTVFKSFPMQIKPGVDYFGVRFVPGFVPQLVDVSASNLVDNQISFMNLPGLKGIAEQIVLEPDFNQQISIFTQGFAAQIAGRGKSSNYALMFALLDLIYQAQGNIRIKDLEEKSGYTARYIQKIFFSYLGMSPKKFCQILRFQSLIKQLNMGGFGNITDLANDHGYFDQSHMLKEFKEFTTLTPKKYVDEITAFKR